MRLTATLAVLLGALAIAPPALADGAVTPDRADASTAPPLTQPSSATVRPPGFTTTSQQVTAIAEATHQLQSLHRRDHPMVVEPFVWDGRSWVVYFGYHGRVVGEVSLSSAGQITGVYTGPLAAAAYARGHYDAIFNRWWVVVPFSVLFLIPFLDFRRLWRLRHLDALVLLSFLLSYWLFNHAHLEAAVWLAYPPLVYLLARMTMIGLGREGRERPPGSTLALPLLAGGLVLLVAARVALSLADPQVMDGGYSAVIGASHIIHGQPIYYNAVAHPDTYGPILYLAYVPFVLLFPWHGTWDYLPSAHVASIVFDLVTVAGLVALGTRLRPGRAGRSLGLALGWAWAANPFTLLALMRHTNDGLIAMLAVLALVVFASAGARGAMLGLAAAAKFSPGALLPLFAGPRRQGWRGAVVCVAAFVLVVVVAIGVYLPPGGIDEFWDHTIGFQLTRIDVFSPWGLHPALAPLQTTLEVAAIAFAVGIGLARRPRSLGQVSALAAAVTIGLQLPANHWFYYYILWFAPFVLVALLAGPSERVAAAPREAARPGVRPEPEPELRIPTVAAV